MSFDELLARHPLPWRTQPGCALTYTNDLDRSVHVLDANGYITACSGADVAALILAISDREALLGELAAALRDTLPGRTTDGLCGGCFYAGTTHTADCLVPRVMTVLARYEGREEETTA